MKIFLLTSEKKAAAAAKTALELAGHRLEVGEHFTRGQYLLVNVNDSFAVMDASMSEQGLKQFDVVLLDLFLPPGGNFCYDEGADRPFPLGMVLAFQAVLNGASHVAVVCNGKKPEDRLMDNRLGSHALTDLWSDRPNGPTFKINGAFVKFYEGAKRLKDGVAVDWKWVIDDLLRSKK